MEKQVIVFDKVIPKKHSVRFDTTDPEAAVSSIYIKRDCLGSSTPKKVCITIEEVD